jgi:hypothetical protein
MLLDRASSTCSGCSDHRFFELDSTPFSDRGGAVRGSTAPSFTHLRNTATSSSGSCPSGGIRRSSSPYPMASAADLHLVCRRRAPVRSRRLFPNPCGCPEPVRLPGLWHCRNDIRSTVSAATAIRTPRKTEPAHPAHGQRRSGRQPG